ncbi:hypothetical protein DPMN_063139 [Dreissena polymorpha]|uniref:Uncharacterized protein n=1 Tax=Dreissena polymorpha TaxID=45954 RepID=A0A9D4HIT0_DREPO|nr:hypothetical protein DPMN_063139 [Dreissena polymorpha]
MIYNIFQSPRLKHSEDDDDDELASDAAKLSLNKEYGGEYQSPENTMEEKLRSALTEIEDPSSSATTLEVENPVPINLVLRLRQVHRSIKAKC